MPSIFCLQDILNWFQFQYRGLLAWTLIRPHLAGTELLTWTIDSCERFKLATVRFCFLNKHLNWRNRWARKGPHSNNWVCHYCFLWGCSISRNFHLRIFFNEKTLQLMAILALCTSLKDMKERISRIVVAKFFICKLFLQNKFLVIMMGIRSLPM